MTKVKEIIDDLEKIRDKKGDKYVIDTFKNLVIASGNPHLAYYFIEELEVYNKEEYISIIIKSGNTRVMFDTMCFVDVDTKIGLTKAIIGCNDADICYLIATRYRDVYKQLKSELERVILNKKDPDLSINYVLNFKDADIEAHKKIVLDSNKAECCYLFAKNIKGTDIEPLLDVIYNSDDLEYIVKCACYIETCDKIRFANKIIESKSPIYNYEFAFQVPGADIKRHGEVVIKSKDPNYNYLYALYIYGADVMRHGQAVIESKDPKYNYLFALNIKEANVVEHRMVLLNTVNERIKQDYLSDEKLTERYENSIIKNKILSLSKEN